MDIRPVLLMLLMTTVSVAQNCSQLPTTLANAQMRVKQDTNSIRMLRAGIGSQDLNDATEQSEEGQKKAILDTISALMDGALNVPDASLGTKSIAGYHLKNGLGSIGTGQANTLIKLIRDEGGVKTALIPILSSLSKMSGKTATLEYLDLLSRAASGLKSTAELGASENTLEETEALFGLAAAIVGRGDIAVSVANSIVDTAYTQTQVYLLSKSISQLTSLSEAQLRSLNILSAKLHRDVQVLQSAKGSLAQCRQSPSLTSAGSARHGATGCPVKDNYKQAHADIDANWHWTEDKRAPLMKTEDACLATEDACSDQCKRAASSCSRACSSQTTSCINGCSSLSSNCDLACVDTGNACSQGCQETGRACPKACVKTMNACFDPLFFQSRHLDKERDIFEAKQLCCGTKYEDPLDHQTCATTAHRLAIGWYETDLGSDQ